MNSKNKILLLMFILITIILFYSNVIVYSKLNAQREMNTSLYEELNNSYTPNSEVLCRSQSDVKVFYEYQLFKPYLESHYDWKNNLLIYRYNNLVCEGCIREDLNNLESLAAEIGVKPILVLPSIPDTRENRINLHNVLKNFYYINIPADTFRLSLNCSGDGDQRFFILINKKAEIESVFFPITSNPGFTKFFFDTIKERLKIN